MTNQTIYTVDRNSPGDCEQGTTIALFSKKSDAVKYARKLNKEDGYNIVLDSDGDMDKLLDEDNYVYFDTGAFDLDECVNDIN